MESLYTLDIRHETIKAVMKQIRDKNKTNVIRKE